MTTSPTERKPKRSLESISIERRSRNAVTLVFSGQLPNFNHQRHVHMVNILYHPPYGRELMHLGLQVMAYRHFVSGKCRADPTDQYGGSTRRHLA